MHIIITHGFPLSLLRLVLRYFPSHISNPIKSLATTLGQRKGTPDKKVFDEGENSSGFGVWQLN